MIRTLLRGQRKFSTAGAVFQAVSYFKVFPKSFPNGGPPQDPFSPNLRSLRKEYRVLQSEHHPDVGSSLSSGNSSEPRDAASSNINRAYTTIRNPYTRAAHVVLLHHPEHMDITEDSVSRELIAKYSADSQENSLNYKMLLMTVLEAHEALEMAGSEADLEALSEENNVRIEESEQALQSLLSQENIPWDQFIIETIKLKYWVNIANGIKEWEPGKPVYLSH